MKLARNEQEWRRRLPPRITVYQEFESFVADLFERYQIDIIDEPKRVGVFRDYDLKIRNIEGAVAIVEIKFYQSLRVAPDILRRTFGQIAAVVSRANVGQGLLVTNARVPAVLRHENDHLAVWDYDTVSLLVENYPDLADRWGRLSQEGFIHRSKALPEPTRLEKIGFLDLPLSTLERGHIPPRRSNPRGADFCKQLKAIKPGNGKSALDFETICTEALKYLFDTDLINWTPQRKSYGQLHRYDLIARVASQNDFWNSLISDHRARYIIFEFKNYKDQITQAEVYSTEKYLFPQAMRSTAIILSRKGATRNAERVIQGAFREAGKLILSIDLEQMCEMLHKRDVGDDPSTVLSDTIEGMLIGLER